ncbi:NAD(P)-dependent oxidoreductase [Nocardioidaceae bacterium]|nr:NAD(P)-dependent oxidoreductase [Nocardioidaceae bacterium]
MSESTDRGAPVVVVTGANGLVGSTVCHALLERGATVRAVVRREGVAPSAEGIEEWVGDFADARFAARVCDETDGLVTTVHPLGADAETQRTVAVEGTPVIARAASACGVPRMVHVSTAAVYERVAGVGDVDEQSALVPEGTEEQDAYAATKRDTDHALAEIEGITRTLVRPPAILGESESSIWNTILPDRMREEESARHAVPDKTFAWVHVDDLAAMIADVVTGRIDEAEDAGTGPVAGGCTPVNVTAERATQRDYVGAVCEAIGEEPVWDDDDAWTGTLRNDRARGWGWSPKVSLEDALTELRAGLG